MFGYPKSTPAPARRATGPRLEQLEVRDVPAIIATGDVFTTPLATVLATTATQGVLANDFSTAFPGQVLSAQLVGLPTYVGSLQPLPNKSLNLNPDGSFSFLTPNQIPTGITQVQFTYQATNTQGELATGVGTITITAAPTKLLAVAAGPGGGPHVRVYEVSTGFVRFNFFPFEESFTGGVRTAVGDLNSDNIDDIVVVAATGGAARVRAFSGVDGTVMVDQFAFDPAFRGGGYVAVGDINGDNVSDIIVGAGDGGGPRVQVFTLAGAVPGTTTTLVDYFAFPANQANGVRVAAGDFQRIGRDFIVAAEGFGGGPQVNVYDGAQILAGGNPLPVLSFIAADASNSAGVYVATGDLRGDGLDDIVTGSGSGDGIVRVFDGRNAGLLREIRVPVDETPQGGGTLNGPSTFNTQTFSGSLLSPSIRPSSLVNGVAGNATPGVAQGGARVTTGDWNLDGLDDIIVGTGPGNAPRVRVINTNNGAEITNILAFSSSFLGGINVGAS